MDPLHVQVSVRTEGRGEPLLLLHGNHGSGNSFSMIAPYLSGRFRLVIPDLPLHGARTGMDRAYASDPGLVTDDCFRIMEELEIRRYFICGHSVGGMIALWMALKRPERIRAAVLLDSDVRYGERPAALLSMHFPGDDEATRQEIDRRMQEGLELEWYRDFDVKDRVYEIRCPVLELFGESTPGTDDLYKAWLARYRRNMPPQWHTERIASASHFLHIERPGAVGERILSFLSGCVSGDREEAAT